MSAAVKFAPFDTVYLFGGTPLMTLVAEQLRKVYRVSMFTAPRQADEFDPVNGVELTIVEDINDLPWSEVMTCGTLGIGIGEAWQFGRKIRALFGDRLVDFMSIPYPRYLGGAHMTHAILNAEKYWGFCMQAVTENTLPGVVHDGAVLVQAACHMPIGQIERRLDEAYTDFIVKFVYRAREGLAFIPDLSDTNRRFYPRLKTSEHGWIDWSWSFQEIVRFVDAFGYHPPGACTTCAGKVIAVHYADMDEARDNHPFHNGLILDRYPTGDFLVSAAGGDLLIRVSDGDGAFLKPGMRLFTSRARLDAAMQYVPKFTPTGDANAT